MVDVVGLVSSIIQIVDFSVRVTGTVTEFCSTTQDVPKVFRNIEAQLPLITSSLRTLGDTSYLSSLSQVVCEDVQRLAVGCQVQIEELEKLLCEIKPGPTDGRLRRGRKAIFSLWKQSEFQKILTELGSYKDSLTLHFVQHPYTPRLTQTKEYRQGSQKKHIRAYLESISGTLEGMQRALDENQEPKTTTEVGTGEPMTTWPTFEAWMDSFAPSQEDIERDEEALARKHKQKAQDTKAPGIVLYSEPESNMKTVKLCVIGLGKEPGKPTRRIITTSPHDEVADVLETLHKEGFNWVTGFAVGEDDNGPLIGPITNQSAKSTVTTTDGVSSYDASTGYAVNLDETLISFFNRTLMSRRPERNELTIKYTFDDIRVGDNYRNECDTTLSIKLMRTVRVPDDDKIYNLPQDFGPFPILDTKDFADTLPPGMKEQGGVFIPMLLREALYISILPSRGAIRSSQWSWDATDDGKDPVDEIFVVRVFAGRANVVSGSDSVNKMRSSAQDYIIAPKQNRLDGFRVDDGKSGTVRQFNTASLGSGYAIEAQVSGTEVGGIQLQFAPRYKRNVEFYAFDVEGHLGTRLDLTATPKELGLMPGMLLVMATLSDPNFDPPCWTWEYPRPHTFDGWGFRQGGWKASRATQYQLRRERSSHPGSDAETKFPSDVHGVVYKEKRPQTQQPKPDKLKIGHRELARASRVSDLFSAAGVSYRTPLFLRPIRPITVKFEIKVSDELRKEVNNLPAEFALEIVASAFEDAVSFRQRVKAAILKKTEAMIRMDNKIRFLKIKACCNDPAKRQMEDLHGKVYPCYLPLHELDISKSLRGRGWVIKYHPKTYGPQMRLALGGGGAVRQDILEDKNPRMWNWDAARVVNIQILNAVAFKSVTGINPPIPAISFEEYIRAGLPLMSYYCEGKNEISRPLALSQAWIQSIGQIDHERGHRLGIRVRKDNGSVVCTSCEHRLCDSILLPCHHIFCNWCIKLHMTRGRAVTCTFCKTAAPTIKLYAAATTVDRKALEQVKPVEKVEALCKSRVRWGGKLDTPEHKPVHMLVLDGITRGHKVGDADWNLMVAQVVHEWEMGLRTEVEVRELASYALIAGNAVKEGTKQALEILLGLGARPRDSEERNKVLEAAKERNDYDWLDRRIQDEGWSENDICTIGNTLASD